MKSKFDGSKCPKCGEEIKKGDEISKDDDQTKWHHAECPKQEQPQPAPPPEQETLPTEPEAPKAKDFDAEKFKAEAKIVNEWARKEAHDLNWKGFDQSETVEDRRARSIDTNVDKKDLFAAYFLMKYGKKID